MPEYIRRWWSTVYPVNLHKTEKCLYCDKIMEPTNFYDVPIKLVIEHYEKQAQNFLVLENYIKGKNMRNLKSNNLGPRLAVQVRPMIRLIEKMDAVRRINFYALKRAD